MLVLSTSVVDVPHLELTQVERRFGQRVALAGVNLAFAPGEKVAFIGPSGSGKSTLIRLLAGELSPTAGEVRIGGRSLMAMSSKELRRYRSSCGSVEQDLGLVPQLSVHRNVLAGLLPGWGNLRVMWSLLWPLERERVGAALGEVGLGDRQWDTASELSGGQRQRVAIARALIDNPKIVFADEPTSSLDPATAKRVVELLLEQGERHQTSVLLSTHWVSVVRRRVDRIVGLRDGRVVLDLPASLVTDTMLDDLYAGSIERH